MRDAAFLILFPLGFTALCWAALWAIWQFAGYMTRLEQRDPKAARTLAVLLGSLAMLVAGAAFAIELVYG